MTNRLWEVDSARGIAIIMMIISNLLLDLYLFAGFNTPQTGFWLYFARITAALFIFLVGVSLTLSYSRLKPGNHFLKYLKRGSRIFSIGLLITAVSWFALGDQFIVFGVLHLIGLGIILSYPLIKRRLTNFLLGIVVIAVGFLLENVVVKFPWLVWVGFKYPNFFSVDYVPVFPWFGFVLLGLFVGNSLFPGGARKFSVPDMSCLPIRFLTKLGRNSLLLYVIHQPILVGIIWLFF